MQADVKGTTMPVLEVRLGAGEHVVSAHGELSWMSPNVNMSQSASTGGQHGLFAGLKRLAGGGGLFLTRYEVTAGEGLVAFAAKLPGRIVPVEVAPGSGYYVHRHGWLAATPGVVPSVGFQQSFRGGLFGGDGFVLERLEGEGTAWVELAGEIINYDLAPGQALSVHPGHVGMFQDSVSFQVTRVPGVANILFGEDGFHLVSLVGPGAVWLQSMPLPLLAAALAPYLGSGAPGAAAAGASGGLAGGALGGLFGRQV